MILFPGFREHNSTSDTSCVWNFLRGASQDSAFAYGVPFDRDVFTPCGNWLKEKDVAHRQFIIGMWAVYEHKDEIIHKTGMKDCEDLRIR